MRKPYPTDLSDAEWNYIEPHLPAPKGHGRPRTHSLREILNAVFYLLKSGCQWRLLPHDFPRWPTVYWYFRKWRIDGTWERINRAIRERLRVRLNSQSVDGGSRRASEEARPRRGAYGVGQGVGQRGRGRRLAEAYAPQRLPGAPSQVGGRAYAVLDRPAKEDEQRLREVVCERGSVGVRCHDPSHDQAARPSLRTFHTASEGEFSEVRIQNIA